MDTRGPRPGAREVDLMPAGKLYWTAVEPIWKKVSIYDGPEKFLKQFKAVTPAQGHLLAAHWCLSEVFNGGFDQFFFNSTGVLAPESAAGFEFLGLKEPADLVRRAMSWLGTEYPRDRAKRQDLMDSAPKRKKAGGKAVSLATLSKKLYAWDKKANGPAALDAFVSKNADLFFKP
jgi:hypothetical protein